MDFKGEAPGEIKAGRETGKTFILKLNSGKDGVETRHQSISTVPYLVFQPSRSYDMPDV